MLEPKSPLLRHMFCLVLGGAVQSNIFPCAIQETLVGVLISRTLVFAGDHKRILLFRIGPKRCAAYKFATCINHARTFSFVGNFARA